MKNNTLKNYHLVVGLGQTGLSCVRHLRSKNIPVVVVDTRDNPPSLSALQAEFPEVPVLLGAFSEDLFLRADKLVVSPGVDLNIPAIQTAQQNGVTIVGDVELFAQAAKAPIIAITGSNGKTTVTTLMGRLVEDAGLKATVCGNIGVPVLDCLSQPIPDYYVVELSSFQLETIASLHAKVAVLINISPDHLDRHPSFEDYLNAKKRIYQNCETAVVNADEPETWSGLLFSNPPICFTSNVPKENVWGLYDQALYYGDQKIVPIADLYLKEKHNLQNFLVVLAIGTAIGLSLDSMVETIKSFSGLPHRCQLVSQKKGVNWINDSKATNVGAVVAAIDSISVHTLGKFILIAGGDSKGVALDDLKLPVKKHISHVITLGKDAQKLATTLAGCADIILVSDMREAVEKASKIATDGDTVLLSPACSSLDQYKNYMARGDDFIQAVEAIDT